MKKWIPTILTILTILAFLICPLFVKADVDYDIDHYYIDAVVLTNGDVEVKEAIYLDGEFNGYIRDILYLGSKNDTLYNASGIENIEVYGKKNPDANFSIFDANLDNFYKVNTAYNGDTGKYELTNTYNGISLKMYQHTDDDTYAFVIKYTLKDAAILHNDVAELRWNFIGNEMDDPVHDLQIKVHLPKGDSSDYFRFWANSERTLAGDVESLDSAHTGVYATAKKLEANDPLTIRVTFDKSLLNASLVSKKDSEDAFDDILEEEQKNADIANAKRKEIRQQYYSAVVLCVVYLVTVAILWIYTYIRHDKEYKPMFQLKYNREFIDDYNVEVIDYLMKKQITSNAMTASIMNLIYKKNITFEEIPGGNKKEYEFTLVNRDNLNATENILVDFLFMTIGADNKFSTRDLKKYAKSTKTCSDFMNSYTKWKNAVLEDGKKEDFFEPKKVASGIIMLVIAFLVFFYCSSIEVESFLPFLILPCGFAYLVYTLCHTKKTKKGIEHYAKWRAFRNFLDDFGTFELKELPEITLWERYLVYATIFGLADKVQKAMNVRIKEINVNDYAYTPIFIYNNINIGSCINESVTSAVSGAQATINRANAVSSISSGSGFGGGFSSGGGFGGGGGGGRGF